VPENGRSGYEAWLKTRFFGAKRTPIRQMEEKSLVQRDVIRNVPSFPKIKMWRVSARQLGG
jgi:hypothetical protein